MRLRDAFLVLVAAISALAAAAVLAGKAGGSAGGWLLAMSFGASLVTIGAVAILVGDEVPPRWLPAALRRIVRPAWAVLAFVVATVVVAVVLLVVGLAIKPADSWQPYLAGTAVVLGLIAFVVALPPIERTALEARLRTVVQLAVALILAAIAIVTFDWLRDSSRPAPLPDFVTWLVGAVIAVLAFLALGRGNSRPAPRQSPQADVAAEADAAPPVAVAASATQPDVALLLAGPRSHGRDRAPGTWTRWLFARWVGGLVAIVSLVPGFLAVTTLAIFFMVTAIAPTGGAANAVIDFITGLLGSSGSPLQAKIRIAVVVVGPLVGLAAWIATGLVAARIATIDRANADMYQKLRTRALGLATSLQGITPGQAPPSTPQERAMQEARAHLDAVIRGMRDDDHADMSPVEWVTGSGYVSMWRNLHSAEEAEMIFCPLAEVHAAALEDRARLNGSNVPQSDTLTARLKDSADAIRAALEGAPADLAAATPGLTAGKELLARLDLRDIRTEIDSFKDERSRELVKVRRRLTQSTVWTGVIAFLLLLLVLLSGMRTDLIAAAAGLYLVAALAGLLLRISREIDLKAGVEDYGVTTARLFLAPLVSGLAGVAGVAVIAILGTPTGLLPTGTATSVSLDAAFNLAKYPVALVLAAAFGLAPSALFSRLQAVSNQLKGDINSADSGSTGQSDIGG